MIDGYRFIYRTMVKASQHLRNKEPGKETTYILDILNNTGNFDPVYIMYQYVRSLPSHKRPSIVCYNSYRYMYISIHT